MNVSSPFLDRENWNALKYITILHNKGCGHEFRYLFQPSPTVEDRLELIAERRNEPNCPKCAGKTIPNTDPFVGMAATITFPGEKTTYHGHIGEILRDGKEVAFYHRGRPYVYCTLRKDGNYRPRGLSKTQLNLWYGTGEGE